MPDSSSPPFSPTPRAWTAALVAGLLAFAMYAWGASPWPQPGDSAELAAVGSIGGVAHPSGYPTFTLLANAVTPWLPGSPTHRVAILGAGCGAASVALMALMLAELGVAWSTCLAGALLFGMAFTPWWAAIRVEVYALGLTLALFALWRTLVARRTLALRDGLLAAFAMGLALTVHLSFAVLLAWAGLLMLARAGQRGTLTPVRALLALVLLLLGLSPYLSLLAPLMRPGLTNYAHTIVEPLGAQFGITPERWAHAGERLHFLLSGPDTRPRALWDHLPTAWGNLTLAFSRHALFEVGPFAWCMALAGAVVLSRRDRALAALLAGAGLATPMLASLITDGALLLLFMMTTTIAVAMLASVALDALARRLPRVAPVALVIAGMLVPHALRMQALAAPAGPAWRTPVVEGPPMVRTLLPSFRHERGALDHTLALLAATPESSLVIAKWEPYSMLMYLQAAEGVRRDLTLDPWYDAHLVRVAQWQRTHDLATHPIVVVDSIPALVTRMTSSMVVRTAAPTALWIVRDSLRTD